MVVIHLVVGGVLQVFLALCQEQISTHHAHFGDVRRLVDDLSFVFLDELKLFEIVSQLRCGILKVLLDLILNR